MEVATNQAKRTRYALSPEQQNGFSITLLLYEIAMGVNKFSLPLSPTQLCLKNLLGKMRNQDLIEFPTLKGCRLTPKGKEHLEKKFLAPFSEYRLLYYPFCAVDTERGEFAFSSFDNMNDDEWKEFLKNERWEDLRVAVVEYKKIKCDTPCPNLDPLAMVFMALLDEGRFKTDEPGWEESLASGEIFNEIVRICNKSLSWEELGTKDVIEDIITQGTAIVAAFRQKEDEQNAAAAAQNTEETITTTTTETIVEEEIIEVPYYTTSYYDPYFIDPFYVSPVWVDPWWIY